MCSTNVFEHANQILITGLCPMLDPPTTAFRCFPVLLLTADGDVGGEPVGRVEPRPAVLACQRQRTAASSRRGYIANNNVIEQVY